MSAFKVLNIGYSNIVVVSKIISMINSDSAAGKRLKNEAKNSGFLIDATQGHKTRSIIITDSNHIVLSSIRTESLTKRLEKEDNSIAIEEENDDEK